MLLLVEDNDEDFTASVRALKEAGVSRKIHRCTKGDEALDYLFRRGEFADPESSPPPDLILLDLNLPGTDGREVLAQIKRDSKLKKTPVVVVTTSSNPRDVEACYENGANSYMVKSIEFKQFQRDIKLLAAYWFQASLLPATADNRA